MQHRVDIGLQLLVQAQHVGRGAASHCRTNLSKPWEVTEFVLGYMQLFHLVVIGRGLRDLDSLPAIGR